ncbi:MAG: STAS domain-containing protein [Abitibacteriaceae bacterium]|nr:STAS domain-containing protein [Abditibacteriaceae bacterium]MBV9866011.1 STAS domain-containing protein [Abditibacteriaceae bacterium]
MDLQLHTLSSNGTTIIAVAGEVELHSAAQLRAELLQACDKERPCIVIDLSGVNFMDSSGIGVIVGALKRARERGGTLSLVGPQPRVRRIFEITGLLSALPFFETVDDAVTACAANTSEVTAQDDQDSPEANGRPNP